MPGKKGYHHGDLKNALIQAGIKTISKEGAGALSLRQVARTAGVSHAAPYAHFADKQALIAAISTEGYKQLYERIDAVSQKHKRSPLRRLVEACWAYVQFALDEPDHFKITLSGLIEREKDYPAYVEISQRSFDLVVSIVEACQQAGILRQGPADLTAVSVWGLVHGIVSLVLEDQLSHTILDRYALKEILVFSLSQMTLTPIDPRKFA
jgi:AcrR family transcriptional regulator